MKDKKRNKINDSEEIKKEFFLELREKNPTRVFIMTGNTIYVDTKELWKIKIPEKSNVVAGKKKKTVKSQGYMLVEIANSRVFLFGY